MSSVKFRLRGNSRVRLVRRKPKADPWAVYDALPEPIRAVLQEGAAQLCPLAARRELRRQRKRRDTEADAIASTVKELAFAHFLHIARPDTWQMPSPHILAHATMQTSRRDPNGQAEAGR